MSHVYLEVSLSRCYKNNVIVVCRTFIYITMTDTLNTDVYDDKMP